VKIRNLNFERLVFSLGNFIALKEVIIMSCLSWKKNKDNGYCRCGRETNHRGFCACKFCAHRWKRKKNFLLKDSMDLLGIATKRPD
jgi:hypothetical protein